MPPTPPDHRSAGFTLVELMTVVAIMAIAAAVAFARIKVDHVQQGASKIQSLLYEAHRQAVTLGPKPSGISDGSGTAPDCMVKVLFTKTTATGEYLNIPYGTTTGTWTTFDKVQFDNSDVKNAQIFNVGSGASYGTSGQGSSTGVLTVPTTSNTGSAVTVELRADGASTVGKFPTNGQLPTGATIYVNDVGNDATNEYKVVTFPYGGTPTVVDRW
jgi:prepilin-type N-terminal cleavage/methylation domain-containing protein